uniref:Uncharacterized protein n=1 Tax=Anguilla anguilla TaxID=7936 RepID=A0A0E9SJ47_ANGAN
MGLNETNNPVTLLKNFTGNQYNPRHGTNEWGKESHQILIKSFPRLRAARAGGSPFAVRTN